METTSTCETDGSHKLVVGRGCCRETLVGDGSFRFLHRHPHLPHRSRCVRPPCARHGSVVRVRASRSTRAAHRASSLGDLRRRGVGVLVRSPLGLALGVRLRFLRGGQPPHLESHQPVRRWVGSRSLAAFAIRHPRGRSALGASRAGIALTGHPIGLCPAAAVDPPFSMDVVPPNLWFSGSRNDPIPSVQSRQGSVQTSRAGVCDPSFFRHRTHWSLLV